MHMKYAFNRFFVLFACFMGISRVWLEDKGGKAT